MFADYFFEKDFTSIKARQNRLFQTYKAQLANDPELQNLVIGITEENPMLPKGVVMSAAMLREDPNSDRLKEINSQMYETFSKKEAEIWEYMTEKYQSEEYVDDMTFTLGNFLKGDTQYGVWFMEGISSAMEYVKKYNPLPDAAGLFPLETITTEDGRKINTITTSPSSGRVWRYMQSLWAYDKLVREGVDPTEARGNLAIDVSPTEIESIRNFGKDVGPGGFISKYIDIFKEAREMGGETIYSAMRKKSKAGEPINYDRSNGFIFKTIDVENMPQYHDLTNIYGYTPDQAKELIYKYIGEPIAPEDKPGEINYLSLEKPNKINFFAERRQKGYVYSSEDVLRTEEGLNMLQPYSPGRYQAATIYAPGTKAYNNLSGSIDFVYSLIPELFADKGVRAGMNQFKNLRRVNKLLDQKTGEIISTGKRVELNEKAIREQIYRQFEKDKLEDGLEAAKLTRNASLKELQNTKVVYKATNKQIKEYGFFGERVPKFFRQTKDEFLSTPFMEQLYVSIAKETNRFVLKANPFFRGINGRVIEKLVKEKNPAKIKEMFGQLLDEGIQIGNQFDQISEMPKVASFALNKFLIDTAKTGKKLQASDNVAKQLLGKGISAVGNENAAFRSARSYLGQGLNIGLTPLRKNNNIKILNVLKPLGRNAKMIDGTSAWGDYFPKKEAIIESIITAKSNVQEIINVTDKKYEKLLGFNSVFNAGRTPSQMRMMGLIPDMGLPLRNFEAAYDQLFAHLQATGYKEEYADAILEQFAKLKYSDHREVRKFAYEQRVRDYVHVHEMGGKHELIAKSLENYTKREEKRFIMFIDEMGENMSFAGNLPEGLEKMTYKGIDGKDRTIIIPSAHLMSEMADTAVQLTDYNLMKRAMSPLFTHFDDMTSMTETFTRPLKDAKNFVTKYINPFSSEYAKKGGQNPFYEILEDGTSRLKTLPVDDLAEDAITMVLDFYNRSIFKPAVLLRAAFFTRVFLEEQMRFAAGHLDSFFTHPVHYLQWATLGQEGKLAKVVRRGGIDENKLLDSYQHLAAKQQTFSLAGLQGRSSLKNKNIKYVMRTKNEIGKGNLVTDMNDYAEAVRFELMLLRSDAIARKVSQFGYGSDDLNKWIVSKEGAAARKELVEMGGGRFKKILNDDDFIDQYLQSVEARIRIKTGGKVEKGTEYFYDEATKQYRYNLSKANANTGNKNLRDAITTGKLYRYDDVAQTGESISFLEDLNKRIAKKYSPTGKTTLSDIDSELAKYVNKKGLDLDLGAVKVSEDIIKRKDMKVLARWGESMDEVINIGFEYLMRKPNAYLSRSVAFKQFRMAHIIENFENYSYKVRDEFIREAENLGVPKKVIKDMKDARNATASGKIDNFRVADVNARAYGLAGTKNLLYDTSRRHMLSDVTRNIFPFPEVWFELATTWSKLLANNPYLIRKGYLTVKGARGLDSGEFQNDAFFAPDPTNPDNELFVHPFSGFLGSLIYGKDRKTEVRAKSYVTGINLLGQGFVPGPNPYVAFALDKVLPKYGYGRELRETFFGEFSPPTIKDVILPKAPWMKKFGAYIQGLGDDIDDFGTDIYKSELAQMRASTTIDIYRYGMLTGENMRLHKAGKLDKFYEKKYGKDYNPKLLTKSDIDEAFLEYSNKKATALFGFRALAQFIGPVGFKPIYYAEDEQGKLWSAQILAEEYRKIREELNQNDVAAAEQFLRDFGYDHGWLTSGKSVSIAGRRSITERVQEWQKENADKLEPYTLSGFFLLPDNPLDDRSYADLYDESIMLNPDQYRRSVNDTVAYYRYAAFSEKVEANESFDSDQKVLMKRLMRNQLIMDYPGFQSQSYGITTAVKAKDIMAEMEKEWLKEGSFALTTDAGKGFAMFWPMWQAFETESMKRSTNANPDWWLSSTQDEARYMRIIAHQMAMQVAEEHPDFYYVWLGVMLRLFRDDSEALAFGASLGK